MTREIIEIDQAKCIGCGLCTKACHQGAIELVNGKAQLMNDAYCDGLGRCLPNCPVDAITLVEKEVAAFDLGRKDFALKQTSCPGSAQKSLRPLASLTKSTPTSDQTSALQQWPVQLHLVHPQAPFLAGANLLIAADCTAYAYAGFHQQFMAGRITLIGCPKLDDSASYTEKLSEIFKHQAINSVTVVRMSVPCCGGLPRLVQQAIQASGAIIPYAEITISTEGEMIPNN